MSRHPKDPLRLITADERALLTQISRSRSEPSVHVERAKLLLTVAAGVSFSAAARAIGRRSNDAVAHLVSRFNREGLLALHPRHGGGTAPQYGPAARQRILAEAQRPPDRAHDGSATWSLTLLQQALRRAPDGLPTVSTYTIWRVLHEAGFTWQRDRSWCPTGQAVRQRTTGSVTVVDPDAEAKKKLIEQAYTLGAALGLEVWCQDEAGPFQTAPYPGGRWQPMGHAQHQSHDYQRCGTAKLLTLFRPQDGMVRVKGVRNCTNAVLHPWLQAELRTIIANLPVLPTVDTSREAWTRWQAGLTIRFSLRDTLPPLRILLIFDNLVGHTNPAFRCWCMDHGIMVLYTPLSGSWLNMAESIQRVLKRRALDGTHPTSPEEAIAWLEAVAAAWNRHPTPFVWSGKRATRRRRARQRHHDVGGSGATALRPITRTRRNRFDDWRWSGQVTH